MRAFLAFPFALAMLAGCTGCTVEPTRVDWWGDERFTAEERAAIQEGADFLYARAGLEPPRIVWRRVDSEAFRPAILKEQGPLGASGECLRGSVFLDLDGNPAINSPPISATSLPGLAAHELAHCRLGFGEGYTQKEPQSQGIMYSPAALVWSDFEESECVRVRCPGR